MLRLQSKLGSMALEFNPKTNCAGDLVVYFQNRAKWSGMLLSPDQQDQLIAHLIEVRGAARVQELLKLPE